MARGGGDGGFVEVIRCDFVAGEDSDKGMRAGGVE